MQPERFKYLMDRLVSKSLSDNEKTELRDLLNQQDSDTLVNTGVNSWLNDQVEALREEDIKEEAEKHLQLIFAADKVSNATDKPQNKTIHRIHFLRKWGWAAACVVIAAGVAGYLFLNKNRTHPADNNNPAVIKTEEILPGKERALLSLADGTRVSLDSIHNGVLALQGGITAKIVNGKLMYEGKGNTVLYNTINTPKGGQYQFSLPDGSKVWLNAASSITFPVAFIEMDRNVRITGEAYFEIAKDKSKPFILDIDGQSKVEVLGTSFNVNSYKGESAIRTTLVEGHVIIKTKDRFTHLYPGDQALTFTNKSDINFGHNVNLEEVLAWKNGLFNFDGADVRQFMRQLERWYDIDVTYEGAVPAIEFQGKMYRDVPLSEVLKVLEKAGVKFRMEKRTIVIL